MPRTIFCKVTKLLRGVSADDQNCVVAHEMGIWTNTACRFLKEVSRDAFEMWCIRRMWLDCMDNDTTT